MNRVVANPTKVLQASKFHGLYKILRRSKSNSNTGYDGAIVISGISGRFPSSENMEKFKENLLGGVDMVKDQTRWASDKIPKRCGFLNQLDKFDSMFFGVVPKLAEAMDPAQRMLLEVTFEAIVDAGINPQSLRNTKTGVFVGALGGEAGDYRYQKLEGDSIDGYGAHAISNFMLPNRISYDFNFHGPSLHVSTGCSSSLVALEAAVNSMRLGKCDAAIIGGTCLHLNPPYFMELLALNAVSPDGKCRAFDHKGNGFVRAEAVAAILIQKASDAKRSYATIKAAVSNSDGFKHEGITYPSGAVQEILIRDAVSRAEIELGQVTYVEAHGTGTPAGDPQEVGAIYRALCDTETRNQPLKIGSVKSNMGHGESAAGICSIAKIAVMTQTQTIPGNLHFEKLNPALEPYFSDGSLQIVKEHNKFDGGVVGITSLGLGGTNAHVLLDTTTSTEKPQQLKHDIPTLLPFSGRTEENVQASLKDSEKHGRNNSDFAALVQNVFQDHIPGNGYRGYWLGTSPTVQKVENVEGNVDRPVWVVFPGMGSQWNEMGKDMMKLDVFADSMQKSKATLKNLGMDLYGLLKPNNPVIFDNIRNAFVSIASVQIALYDTLMSLGIKPQGFIGHSAGEALCAYADGCLSHEETILVMEARGRAFIETLEEPLAMASVGMSWADIAAKCPPNVYPACNNAAFNVSVAGSAPSIKQLVQQLQSEGTFAREVNSCNTAPHTPYMTHAGELFMRYITEIFQDKRPRSSKWISTSIPEAEWGSELAKFCSADYICNNLLNKVLFYDAIKKIPEKACVLEVGPRGLFQAILKESTPSNCVHIAPMHPKAEDKVGHFLQSVGNMYTSGVDVKISELYPKVNFPVAADTPFLGPLVRWDHDKSWKTSVIKYPTFDGKIKTVDLQDAKDRFLDGHKLDDRIVFPATGYLVMAWKNLASTLGIHYERLPVIFSNVSFERATFLNDNKPTELTFSMLDGGKSFEIKEEGAVVVRGNIASSDESPLGKPSWIQKFHEKKTGKITMNTDEIYKEFGLRGYNYTGEFRGIQKIDIKGTQAEIAWKGNWVTLLDTALQTMVLRTMTRNTLVPVRLQEIVLDPANLLNYAAESQAKTAGSDGPISLPVDINSSLDKVECPGIRIRGLTASVIPRKRTRETLAFESHEFKPNFGSVYDSSKRDVAVAQLVDFVLENSAMKNINFLEVLTEVEDSLAQDVKNAFVLKPQHQINASLMTLASEAAKLDESVKSGLNLLTKETLEHLVPESNFDLLYLNDANKLPQSLEKCNGFLITKTAVESPLDLPEGASVVSNVFVDNERLSLIRKAQPSENALDIRTVSVDGDKFSWLPSVQKEMANILSEKKDNIRLYLTSQVSQVNGILGLVNCLRQEPGGDKIRCIFDPSSKLNLDFQSPDPILASIIKEDLAINVLQGNELGSYRHLPVESKEGSLKKVQDAYVNTLTTGDLTSLRWIESPLKYKDLPIPAGQERCKVAFAAMNFRDVMLATGKLPIDASASHRDCVMGLEFSGYDSNGSRIMGTSMAASKALATSVVVDKSLLWPVPESWSLEEAATVPIVYATAYYAMCTRGRLRRGQSVLIHSGTGGVGQAAISIALAHGCNVFTTVGTPDKRDFILKLFPELKAENIGNSRDCSFEEMVMTQTNGKGVDVVLNSLAEEKLQASIRCLGTHGKFLEIGAFDASQNNPLGMSSFLKNTEFHGIYLNQLVNAAAEVQEEIRQLIMDGISKGVVRPLPRHTYQKDQIEEAFRFMASGKHTGKVVIQVRDEAQGPNEPVEVDAISRTYFHPAKPYVVIGGLGGLGLEVASWLVDRGARHLVLPSRSGVTTGYQALCIRKWTDSGVRVETPKIDLTNEQTCDNFFFDLNSNGSIGGIFNSSLVLRDATIENQTIEAFEQVAAPKINITERLDQLSRKYAPDMDYFVAFSSGAAGRGNAGQSNYGFANSVMERICEQRTKDGLHGLAVQWGVIGEVGFVAEKFKGRGATGNTEIFQGTLPQSVQSCLDVLDSALQQGSPVCSSMIIADKEVKSGSAASLIQRMTHIFGVKDASKINDAAKLTDMGMDSLIAIELKQTLDREFDLPLTTVELRGLTFGDLKAIDAGTFSKNNAAVGSANAGDDSSKHLMTIADIAPLNLYQEPMVRLNDGKEFDANVFVVHGIDGGSSCFKDMATDIDANVYAFQATSESKPDDISEIAKVYVDKLVVTQPEGPYNIAAYSAGGAIAYEMVRLLEQRSQKVQNLIFLDGTCNWITDAGINAKLLFSEVTKTLPFFEGLDKTVWNDFLSNPMEDFQQDQKITADLIQSMTNLEPEARDIVRHYLRLTQAIQQYQPSGSFAGQTTLIKAGDDSVMRCFQDQYYKLDTVCTGELQVYDVPGNHSTFLRNTLTAKIINEVIWKPVEGNRQFCADVQSIHDN